MKLLKLGTVALDGTKTHANAARHSALSYGHAGSRVAGRAEVTDAEPLPKKVRASYNQAEYLYERRAMMQCWADYLDGLKNGAEVIPLYGKLA